MTTGALLAEDLETEGISAETVLLDSLAGAIQSVMDLPVMTAIQDASNAYTYSEAETDAGKLMDAAISYLGSQASSFIPNALAGIAQGTDSYQRDSYSAESTLGQIWDNVKAKVPGLRETLPAKVDSFGDEMETEGGILGFLNSNILPGYIQHYNTNALNQEIQRLSNDSGVSVYPSKRAPSSVSYGGQTYSMTSDEKRAYQQVYGQTAQELMQNFIDSAYYNDMDDGERADIMSQLLSYANDEAKKALVESRGGVYESSWDDVRGMENIGTYLTFENAYKAAQDGEGTERFDALMQDYDTLDAESQAAMGEISGFEKTLHALNSGVSADMYFAFKDKYNNTDAKNAQGETEQGLKKKRVIEWATANGFTQAEAEFMYSLIGASLNDLPIRG